MDAQHQAWYGEIFKNITWVGREQLVQILEAYCIQCYDWETREHLQEALLVNAEDDREFAEMVVNIINKLISAK